MNIKKLLTNTLFLKTLIVVQGVLIVVAMFVLGYVICNRDKIPHLLSDERKAKIASALKVKRKEVSSPKIEITKQNNTNKEQK